MAASLDFTSVNTCSGGGHYHVDVSLNVDGNIRTKNVVMDVNQLVQPVTEEEIEVFLKVILRIFRAQSPANLRQAILNKVVNLNI